MYPQQYPSAPSAPPPYNNNNMQYNPVQNRTSLSYHSTSEERMADFQQLVDRYESKLFRKLHDQIIWNV